MKKYFAIILAAGLLLSACSPANQPGMAVPSDVVEQTEQETTDTIVENKTEVPKEDTTSVSPEKKEPVDSSAKKEETLPKKLSVPDVAVSTVRDTRGNSISFGKEYTKIIADQVLLQAEPIKASAAKDGDYRYIIQLFHSDGLYYGEYAIDLQIKQLRVDQAYYRLNDAAMQAMNDLLALPKVDRERMQLITFDKNDFEEADGIHVITAAIYPDRVIATLKNDPSVSVLILTEEDLVTCEEYVMEYSQYWKSSDGKQLLFDTPDYMCYADHWPSKFEKDGDMMIELEDGSEVNGNINYSMFAFCPYTP